MWMVGWGANTMLQWACKKVLSAFISDYWWNSVVIKLVQFHIFSPTSTVQITLTSKANKAFPENKQLHDMYPCKFGNDIYSI